MNKEYKHYSNYPKSKWRWDNFMPIELRSKSDNRLMVDPESMDKLQALRDRLGVPLYLTSAYRSKAHNELVGGAEHSKHLEAKAFDVQMRNLDPATFLAAAIAVGFTGFGFYEKSGFIHVDTGPARTWGKRWFPVAAKKVNDAAVEERKKRTIVDWILELFK